MTTKRFLTAAFFLLCTFQLTAQQSIYKVDFDDYSSFSNSCGSMEAGAWRVTGDSCVFTSAIFVVGENVLSGIDIDLTAMVDGKMTGEEKIHGYYFINGNVMKLFVANGSQFIGDYKRMDHLSVKPGHRVMIKLALVSGSKDRSWIINSGDIKVTVPEKEVKQVATTYNGRTIKVLWNYETNNDCNYFIIERSQNGHDFSQIGLVKAEVNNRNTFQLLDNGMAQGVNYYRVKVKKFAGEPVQIGNISMLNTEDELSEARN